jgi:hypothetical protein
MAEKTVTMTEDEELQERRVLRTLVGEFDEALWRLPDSSAWVDALFAAREHLVIATEYY